MKSEKDSKEKKRGANESTDTDSDDSDFVPAEAGRLSDGEGSDSALSAASARIGTKACDRDRPSQPNPPPQNISVEKDREQLWTQFKDSARDPTSSQTAQPSTTVRIVKRVLYAGQELSQVVEVPEDSQDAKAWPRAQETDLMGTSMATTSQTHPTAPDTAASVPDNAYSADRVSTPVDATKKPGPGPGPNLPRRPKKRSLGDIPPTKAKKISTLDKSLMDWDSHVNKEDNQQVRDELEANRRGGGYIEKVEFMQRVSDRKDEDRQAGTTKRRRT